MNRVAARGLCFALIGLIATIAAVGQEPASPGALTWDEVSAAPGTHSDSVSLYPRGLRELEYRFLDQAGDPHTRYFLPLNDGVELHAPDNTEIRYRVALRRVGRPETTIAGEFFIDTLAPAAPRLEPSPGLYTAPVDLMPQAGSDDERVALRIVSDEKSRFAPPPVGGLRLSGDPGTVQDYRIAAYSVDASGNRSSVATYRYRIDQSRQTAPVAQPLLSPRPGVYANRQILLLDDTGLDDVSVQLHRPDAEPVALDYRGTAAINGTGELRLVVQGAIRVSGERYRDSVTWIQSDIGNHPSQGQFTSTVRLRPPPSRSRYTFEDRSVADTDPFWLRVAELTPPPDGTRAVVVRYKAEKDSADTRLVYLMDGRRAPTPELTHDKDQEVITAYSLADTEVQWAQIAERGVTPVADPTMGTAGIALSDLPADSVLVRARYPGGEWTQRVVSVEEFRTPSSNAQGAISDDGVTVSVDQPGADGLLTIRDERSGAQFLRYGGESTLRWRPPTGFSIHLQTGGDQPLTATVDRTPLPPPELSVNESRISLTGEGQIFYRLDGSPDEVYEAPLALSGIPNARRRYRLDTYRILDGRISPSVTIFPVVDQRVPTVPSPRVVSGTEIRPREFLSRDELTRVVFTPPYEDLELFYEVSSDGQALLPQTDSPRVGNGILLTTPDNREVRWALRVRGRFPGREQWSPVYRLGVTVDRQPPSAPVLASDPHTSGVIAFEPPSEEDATIWYRLRENDPYRMYQGPVTIDRDRMARALTVSAYTRDIAGNRAVLEEPPVVTPISQRPAPPELSLNGRVPDGSHIVLAREAVLEAVEPHDVRWRILEVSSDGPAGQFHPVSEPEVLSRGTYRINAYREQGTQRSRVVELVVTIDPERPQTPERPYVSYAPDGRSGTVYWSGAQSERIFASIITDPEADPRMEPLSVSDGILTWAIPEGASSVSLAYFSVGQSGRRSETEVIHLEAVRSRPPAVLSGVRHGERYRTERVVELEGNGDIRFTATSDGSSPGTVRVSSALYEEPLVVNASIGETTHYRLRYRTFEKDSAVSDEQEISFVIDREPPSVPQLRGANPDGYYDEGRSVTLEPGEDGDTVMYRMRSDPSVPRDFSRYLGEEILLAADNHEPLRYQIEAYAIDRAGNRSTGIATWDITIDATSLHVSVGFGDDQTGDGSRGAPLASLDAALRTVARSSRDTIFLAVGDYSVSSAVIAHAVQRGWSGRLNLIGGYDPETWIAEAGGTSVALSDGAEIPLVGTVRLERLSFSQPLRVAPRGAEETNVELRHVEVQTPGGAGAPGLVQAGGRLVLFNSRVTHAIGVESGARLEASGSSLGSVSLRDAAATVSDSLMAGVRITGGSSLVVTDSRITADRSVGIGGLVYAEDSSLQIRSSAVHSRSDGPILIRGRNANIEVAGSLISGEGERSAIAFRTRGGRIAISNTVVDVTSHGYGYGLFFRDSHAEITGSVVVMRVAGDGIAVAAGDSAVSIDDSLLWISGANPQTPVTATAISVNGSGVDDLVVSDSDVLAHGTIGESSSAVRLGSDGAARIFESSFGGWPYALIRRTTADRWERSGRLTSIDDLDRSHFGGDNRQVETSEPPVRLRTPAIPDNPVPAPLIQLRTAAGDQVVR